MCFDRVQEEAEGLQRILTDRTSFVRVLREYLDRTEMLVHKYTAFDVLEEEQARQVPGSSPSARRTMSSPSLHLCVSSDVSLSLSLRELLRPL